MFVRFPESPLLVPLAHHRPARRPSGPFPFLRFLLRAGRGRANQLPLAPSHLKMMMLLLGSTFPARSKSAESLPRYFPLPAATGERPRLPVPFPCARHEQRNDRVYFALTGVVRWIEPGPWILGLKASALPSAGHGISVRFICCSSYLLIVFYTLKVTTVEHGL